MNYVPTADELARLKQIAERLTKTTPALVKTMSSEPDAGQVFASEYGLTQNGGPAVAELTVIDRAGGAYMGEIWDSYNFGERVNDAEFIANAYEDVPFLLALIERLTIP